MNHTLKLVSTKAVTPLKPIHVFPATKLTEAFRFMQQGQHIGKIVISMPQPSETPTMTDSMELPVAKSIPPVSLGANGTYLVIGGLGGVGKVITTWLVERGARSVIFLSPSAGKRAVDQEFFRELRYQGCQVSAVAGNVADKADVRRAAESATSPIIGVLQLAMVLTVSCDPFAIA